MFAARALKRAFFGTPAPPIEDTALEVKTGNETIGDTVNRDSQCNSVSPTKLPGILLTPGTATTRRKTVSFGTEVSDKSEKNIKGQARVKSGQTTSTQKERSSNRVYRKTPLTETLELAREIKPGQGDAERNHGQCQPQPMIDLSKDRNGAEQESAKRSSVAESNMQQTSNEDLLREVLLEETDGDMTMDLNEPRSQSGKYWKSEYEQYHDEAKTEMQKLLKYKQLAKSYAKKKDAETVTLTEKLKEEQRRVINLEDRISQLSAQLTTTGFHRGSDASPDLIKELAKQTALTHQYKAQAEAFRAAAEGKAGHASIVAQTGIISSLAEDTLTDNHLALRTPREQLKELTSLREEVTDLRQALLITKQTNSKLQEEKAKLTQDLLDSHLRLEEQQGKSERCRQTIEEQLQKKVEAYNSLQQDYNTLKEKAKSQRGNAEHLLKKKHDQVMALRKELVSMRRTELATKDLVQHLQKPIGDELGGRSHQQHLTNIGDRIEEVGLDMKSRQSRGGCNSRDSQLPALSQSISAKTRSPTYLTHRKAESAGPSFTMQAPQAGLSEIFNDADAKRPSPKRSTLLGTTLPSHRISSISHGTPSIDLPSPEPSLSYTTDYIAENKKYKPSPRPSMFTFASSPPKPEAGLLRSLDKLPSQKVDGNFIEGGDALVASTRLASLRGSRSRTTLPPERAAAAKARLERKNAEKKRAQVLETNKENILH